MYTVTVWINQERGCFFEGFQFGDHLEPAMQFGAPIGDVEELLEGVFQMLNSETPKLIGTVTLENVQQYHQTFRSLSVGDVVTLSTEDKATRFAVEHLGFREITEPKPFKLVRMWCWLEHNERTSFHSYPEDGECECGLWKHHVHCGHGFITQVG